MVCKINFIKSLAYFMTYLMLYSLSLCVFPITRSSLRVTPIANSRLISIRQQSESPTSWHAFFRFYSYLFCGALFLAVLCTATKQNEFNLNDIRKLQERLVTTWSRLLLLDTITEKEKHKKNDGSVLLPRLLQTFFLLLFLLS